MAGFDGDTYQQFLVALERVEEAERQLDHLFATMKVERAPKPEPVDLTPKPTAAQALDLLSHLPPAELDRLRAALGQTSTAMVDTSAKVPKAKATTPPAEPELVGAEA